MERIGRYEIVRELGRGSMAIVYEGFDGRIDRHLAIKVLRGHLAGDVSARQRFLREARAAGGLSHPNIVTVFDVGLAESKPYLVMELLAAGTLDDWLSGERYEQLSIDTILEIAAQLARALDYAHAQGVIHRDIKPGNIHFDPVARQVKLMDFGIAAVAGGRERAGATSTEEIVSGTPSHMAPELIHGHAADERSDLYSLGVVLYQLLCGRLPFSGTDCATILRQVAAHDMLPLAPTRADTPRELIDLCDRLLALKPESRPSSARQLAEELEEIIEGRRRGLLRNVRRQSLAWRNPALIGAMVAVVLGVGMTHVYTSQTAAMAQASYGFGDALVSLVAQETAEALILEDITALGVLVSDFAANPEVRYLHLSGPDGLVMASTNPFLKGQPLPEPTGKLIERPGNGITLHRDGEGLLEFSAPIRFQARRVGDVRLGLDGSALNQAARATLVMLLLVFGAAMLAVLAGLWWITRRQQQGLRRLAWGLKRLQRGQYEFRLNDDLRHELSEPMREFNKLALMLQQNQRRPRPPSSTNPAPPPTSSAWQSTTAFADIDSTLDLSRPQAEDTASDGHSSDGDPSRITPIRGRGPR